MYLSFEHPYYLVFLFVIPLLIFSHFFGLKNLRGKSLRFANFEAIARIKGIDIYSKNIGLVSLNILIIFLMVMGLSGATLYRELSASSFSFVISIDASESMGANDILPDRLSAAKETAISFINSLPSDSYVGIVSFAGETMVNRELTKNKLDLKNAIEGIEISSVSGTDLSDSISNSADMLKTEGKKSVILLSDGQINVGTINEAIETAKDNNLIINCFGIGTSEGGQTSYGLSKIDEDSLKSLSFNTGGQYFKTENKQELENSFGKLFEVTQRLGQIDLTSYLFISVIILFLIKEFLLSINRIF